MKILLTREQFNQIVMARDKCCVVCNAQDDLAVHHILDRSLFDDGGYYYDNGVTLCPKHHLLAEDDVISCDELREMAGITDIVLPEGYDPDQVYNKWGITVTHHDENGTMYECPDATVDKFEKLMKRKYKWIVLRTKRKYAKEVLGINTNSDNLIYLPTLGRIPCSRSRNK